MKNKFKIIWVSVCCLVVLFLLLPILFPQKQAGLSAANGENTAQQAATPIVFTSNPLAKIVQKLAKLFRNNKQTPSEEKQPARAQLAKGRPTARFANDSVPFEEEPASAFSGEEEPAEGETANTITQAADNGQTDADSWVLIRQTAPEIGNEGGMHEISVKDNAYDRYIKQERAARFIPSSRPPRREVPDSKLARLFHPIKEFLGFEDGQPVPATQLTNDSVGPAYRTGQTDGFGENKNFSLSDLMRKNSSRPFNMNMSAGYAGSAQEQSQRMLNMILPHATIFQAAKMIADSLVPNPQNRKEQARHDDILNETIAKYTAAIDKRINEELVKLARDENQNGGLLSKTFGCEGSAFISSSDTCSPPENSSQLEEIRQNNQQRFQAETGYALPENVPIALVLSKASEHDMDNPSDTFGSGQFGQMQQQPEQQSDPKKEMLIEKYKFMFSQKKCSDANPCFWVADNMPKSQQPGLDETFYASGAKFLGDPTHTSQDLTAAFVQHVQDSLPKDMPEEERQEKLQAAQNAHTAYLLADANELRQIQDENIKLVLQGLESGDKNLIYMGRPMAVSSATTALELSHAGVHPYVIVTRNNAMLDLDQSASTQKRSDELTSSLISAVEFTKESARPIIAEASQQAVSNQAKPALEKLKDTIKNLKKAFKSTGKTFNLKDMGVE